MIGMRFRSSTQFGKIKKQADQSKFKSLGQAGALIRAIARRSIKRRKKPSPPGSEPHTRQGQLKTAIRFAVEKNNVVVGATKSLMGPSASVHEHGGRIKDDRYPERPFMGPALDKVRDRLPKMWKDSVR